MAYTNRHLITVVIVMLGCLFVAAALLGTIHHRVRDARTESHRRQGQTLAAQKQLVAAAMEYRAALSLEPDDRHARRALALTLLSLGRLAEAESYLRDLLNDAPTDGVLNRALARIHAARSRDAEAKAAFQRAIYGEWADLAGSERVETRFELIDYLRRVNAREEVLAELLRLKAELPPGSTAGARRVAELLLEAGAPDLALDTLAAAAITAPKDVELLTQLADLQTDLGRYGDARATLRRASALDPKAGELAARLTVVDRVLALDPTLPRLRLVTRTRRARLVLAAVVDQTRACSPEGTVAGEARRRAAARLRQPVRSDAEAAEQDLALAAHLWADAPACHGSGPEARALTQVMRRVEAAAEPPS